jgi:hypothetical protein
LLRSLLEAKDGLERADAALRIAIEKAQARGGYLYLGPPGSMDVAASDPVKELPPASLTEQIAMVAEEAVAAQESTVDAGNGTMGAHGTRFSSSGVDPELHIELLLIPHAGGAMVVGALVLKPATAGLQPLAYDLLEAIARSLYGVKDYCTDTCVADAELSALFVEG